MKFRVTSEAYSLSLLSTTDFSAMSARNPTVKAANALRSFLPQKPPPTLDTRAGNLYQVLSRYPQDGVGLKVHQTRWGDKGIARSYWKITRSSLKMEGRHGKAYGKLFWKGELSLSCNWRSPLSNCVTLLATHITTTMHIDYIVCFCRSPCRY